jgi:hypothetical protein
MGTVDRQQKGGGGFSGSIDKTDSEGQPHLTIPHISQGFQKIKFRTGCDGKTAKEHI